MNLREAFDLLNIMIKPEDQAEIMATPDLDKISHFGLGRFIRNSLHLWEENGTQAIVQDILSIPNHSKYTTGFVLPGQPPLRDFVDDTLLHPDNCSHVIIQVYRDYLKGLVQV